MSASFFRPRPTLREQLAASVRLPPDQIDLYGALRDAAIALGFAANDAMHARRRDDRIPDAILDEAEAACTRTLRAIANYRWKS